MLEDEKKPQVERNPDGTVKGGTLNPSGTNGFRHTGMPFKMRAALLEEQYPTLEDLFGFFDFDAVTKKFTPNTKMKKLPHRDASIINIMFLEYSGEDRVKAHNAFWDRDDGKPTQRTELTGAGGGPIAVTDESREVVLGKLLPEVAAGSSEDETRKPD